jgi:ketosteroid isomerase-like protein
VNTNDESFIMQVKIIACFILPGLMLAAVSCSNQTSGPKETLDAIILADNAGDIEKVVALYCTDAVLLPPGRANISGQSAIRQNYTGIFSSSTLHLRATTDTIEQCGQLATITGTTSGQSISKSGTDTVNVNDKFMMVLKKISGRWKIYRLMWNKAQ